MIWKAEIKCSSPEQIIRELDMLNSKIKASIHKSQLAADRKKMQRLPQPHSLVGGQLKEHQFECLSWMCQLGKYELNGILADDMGLGKTIEAIAYICWLNDEQSIKGKHLIVVPKNVLRNWLRELTKWSPQHRAIVLPGTETERNEVIEKVIKPRKFDIIIATYQSAQSAFNILNKFYWETLFVDEAHSIKNEETCLASCLRVYQAKFKVLMTGTPLSNRLHELWSLLNFILPEIFCDSSLFSRIEASVDAQSSNEEAQKQFQIQVSQRFQQMLRPFLLRRTKHQINLGLKEKKEITLFVPLVDLQLKMYRNYLKYRSVFGEQAGRQQNKAVQLRKICCHPYTFPEMEDPEAPILGEHLISNSGKMQLLDKLLAKFLKEGHKILIFSQLMTVLRILEDYLTYREYKYCLIDGSCGLDQRQTQVQRFFNDPASSIFLISTRAGGIGLNLTIADVVILYDIDWNPQMDRQAMDRAYRIGQMNDVRVFKFITKNTVEQRMYEVQKYKLIWEELVIQKGGIAYTKMQKTLDQQFDKSNFNQYAEKGGEQIFQLQHNYDDKTIEEIIRLGEEKDREKTREIRKKLEEQFKKYNENSENPYTALLELDSKKSSLKHIDYKMEPLGFTNHKQKKSLSDVNVFRAFIKPPAYQLYSDPMKAGQLLFRLRQVQKSPNDSIGENAESIIDQLQELGFYSWSEQDYKQFIKANENIPRDKTRKVQMEYLPHKSLQEISDYASRFYGLNKGEAELRRDLNRVSKAQEDIKLEEEIEQLEKFIKKVPLEQINLFKCLNAYPASVGSFQMLLLNSVYCRLNGKTRVVNWDDAEPILEKLMPKANKQYGKQSISTKLRYCRFLRKIKQGIDYHENHQQDAKKELAAFYRKYQKQFLNVSKKSRPQQSVAKAPEQQKANRTKSTTSRPKYKAKIEESSNDNDDSKETQKSLGKNTNKQNKSKA